MLCKLFLFNLTTAFVFVEKPLINVPGDFGEMDNAQNEHLLAEFYTMIGSASNWLPEDDGCTAKFEALRKFFLNVQSRYGYAVLIKCLLRANSGRNFQDSQISDWYKVAKETNKDQKKTKHVVGKKVAAKELRVEQVKKKATMESRIGKLEEIVGGDKVDNLSKMDSRISMLEEVVVKLRDRETMFYGPLVNVRDCFVVVALGFMFLCF
jgi:hypothetical protein